MWMQGPFIAGFSFAREDIGILLFHRRALGIGPTNLFDRPLAGDQTMEMTRSHGKKWVAWQEVWLKGLEALPRGSKVSILPTEDPSSTIFYHNPQRTTFFRQKYEDEGAFKLAEQRDKVCFDPQYKLGPGEQATTILNWEARQIMQMAEANRLVITQIWESSGWNPSTGTYQTTSSRPKVGWYCAPFADHFEIKRDKLQPF